MSSMNGAVDLAQALSIGGATQGVRLRVTSPL
jgi:hypothetical protein